MSIRLFHRGARLVVRLPKAEETHAWCAFHRSHVPWHDVFGPALAMLGFAIAREDGAIGFGNGRVRWTRGPFWTTIRVTLPDCSARKAELLAAGLLKAARYRHAAPGVEPAALRST